MWKFIFIQMPNTDLTVSVTRHTMRNRPQLPYNEHSIYSKTICSSNKRLFGGEIAPPIFQTLPNQGHFPLQLETPTKANYS